jgi:hypothetical protein
VKPEKNNDWKLILSSVSNRGWDGMRVYNQKVTDHTNRRLVSDTEGPTKRLPAIESIINLVIFSKGWHINIDPVLNLTELLLNTEKTRRKSAIE